MDLTLSHRQYLAVDRASKLVGVAALVAALAHAAGPWSAPLGLAGVAVGVATVFVGSGDDAD